MIIWVFHLTIENYKYYQMKLNVIKNEAQYDAYLEWADRMFDKGVAPDSTEGESLQVALLLIKQY
jgi:HTH-type transcriptional regulator/antitoxin HigA